MSLTKGDLLRKFSTVEKTNLLSVLQYPFFF